MPCCTFASRFHFEAPLIASLTRNSGFAEWSGQYGANASLEEFVLPTALSIMQIFPYIFVWYKWQ